MQVGAAVLELLPELQMEWKIDVQTKMYEQQQPRTSNKSSIGRMLHDLGVQAFALKRFRAETLSLNPEFRVRQFAELRLGVRFHDQSWLLDVQL